MKNEILLARWMLPAIMAWALISQPSLAEQAFCETFKDGYPDGGIGTDVKGDAHPWQHGLEERTLSDWAPAKPLEKNVQIQATLTDVGRLYELDFIISSGDGQLDADCLQALLGAAAYSKNTDGIVRGGRLSSWDFKFDQNSQVRHKNHAVSEYFKGHPELKKNNTVAVFKIPTAVLTRYPGRFTEAEIVAPSNLFTLNPAWRDNSRPEDKCGALRPQAMYSIIDHYAKWQNFFSDHPNASKSDILKFSEVLEKA